MLIDNLDNQQHILLWDKYNVPENIRQHSLQVARIASAVAQAIIKQHSQQRKIDSKRKISLNIIEQGALLHDLAKIIAIEQCNEKGHGKLGHDILVQEGVNQKIANIVLYHVLENFNNDLTLNQQIVNYADKRVNHNKIVSLEARKLYLINRYPGVENILNVKLPLLYKFEQEYNLDQLSFSYE